MDASFFDARIERRDTASFKWDMYGEDELPLWVADMDFASPPPVVRALEARAAHGVFGYALTTCSLVEAIAAHFERRYGWRIEEEWIVWLPSVVPGLNLACDAFAAPGEAVMTVTPVYPPFLGAPANRERRLITVPAEVMDGRWELPLAGMEAAVTPDTRVLLFCHPHNPLGRVWRRDEVEAMLHFCRRHDLVLVSDEIHCDLILDDLAHMPAATLAGPGDAGRIVTLSSPSKTFNLPGLNYAFAIVPDEELRQRFARPGKGLLPFPGCFAVAAAEAAYREGGDWHEALLDYLRGNRDALEAFVASELPQVRMTHVEATYLAWLDVRELGLEDPAAACRSAGVALSAGAAFGDPAYLRLNFGCPRATLDEALQRLATVLR
jgi:cysteine-S-conjugate beta-lyase